MRTLYYSASVITLTGGNTNAHGEPCKRGHGYTEQSGHWSAERSCWTVEATHDVEADFYPDDSPLIPAEWLADHVTDRLGDLDHNDGHIVTGARTAIESGRLTGPEADEPGAVAGTRTLFGDVVAAYRLRTALPGTRTLTAVAHVYGFTDTELAPAATLLGHTASTAERG